MALDVLDLDHPEKDAVTWERAIRKLRGGMMPPPGAPRPPLEAVNTLATYLEDSLDKASAANLNPGSVRIHRLNRAEYANAVRDLFGMDVDAAALLPSDDISDGFDNIASALKASPSFLDQYIMAARAVVETGHGNAAHRQRGKTTIARDRREGAVAARGSQRGYARFLAPYEGDYEIRAGLNPAVFTVDGERVDATGAHALEGGSSRDCRGECGPQFRRERRRFAWICSGRGGNRLFEHRIDRGRHDCRW